MNAGKAYDAKSMTLERFGFIGMDKKCFWGMVGVEWITPLKIEQIKPGAAKPKPKPAPKKPAPKPKPKPAPKKPAAKPKPKPKPAKKLVCKYYTVKSPYYGGGGGGPFTVVPKLNADKTLNKDWYVSKVTVRKGASIDAV